jgi:hypothetical protein
MMSTDNIPVPPIERIAEAALNTVASPTPEILVEDLILVHQLVTEVKAKLAGKSPTLINMFGWLFHS